MKWLIVEPIAYLLRPNVLVGQRCGNEELVVSSRTVPAELTVRTR